MFTNPVIDEDFPDPDILHVDETYYAYSTNVGSRNVPVATSGDLVAWDIDGDALPVLPAWASPGLTWAPEVAVAPDGSGYRLYYTVRHTASDLQCIGHAAAERPDGPFEPVGDEPLVCQIDDGGSIDPSTFVDDDDTPYLLWKNDGNCCGKDTWIYLQQLSDDGLTLEDEPVRLIVNDQPWEGDVVEAPTLWKHDGTYHLFYSANSYAGDQYAIGHATADAAGGPYHKDPGPWLATQEVAGGFVLGPGGQDVVVAPNGQTWLAYHSWDPTVSYRRMNLDRLAWRDGRPVIDGPTLDARPEPTDE